jgi:hypothetical protein
LFSKWWNGRRARQSRKTVRLRRQLAEVKPDGYIVPMNFLTKQEQLVLCIVLGLLLTGWAVKTYRAAHPPAAVPIQPAKP